jgi:hypothetical protein
VVRGFVVRGFVVRAFVGSTFVMLLRRSRIATSWRARSRRLYVRLLRWRVSVGKRVWRRRVFEVRLKCDGSPAGACCEPEQWTDVRCGEVLAVNAVVQMV